MDSKVDIFNEHIKEKAEELKDACVVFGVPFFLSICIDDSDKKTTYKNYMNGSVSNGIKLHDDQIKKHINVANGFYTVPPQTGEKTMDDMVDEMMGDF